MPITDSIIYYISLRYTIYIYISYVHWKPSLYENDPSPRMSVEFLIFLVYLNGLYFNTPHVPYTLRIISHELLKYVKHITSDRCPCIKSVWGNNINLRTYTDTSAIVETSDIVNLLLFIICWISIVTREGWTLTRD